MTAQEERCELIQKAQQGDKEAMEQLVTQNSPLVWSIVRRFLGRGVEKDDLYQLGCMGLLKAVEGFDPAFATQFSTYAVPKIAGEIRRFLRDDGLLKVSRSVKENQNRVMAARTRLESVLGREPRLSEIAEETGLTPEEIAAGETACQSALSLNAEWGEDGFRLMDICPAPDEEEGRVELLALREAMALLPQREQTVLTLRYFRDLTQQKVAQILGVSQVQVSRIEKKAIAKVKKILEDSG